MIAATVFSDASKGEAFSETRHQLAAEYVKLHASVAKSTHRSDCRIADSGGADGSCGANRHSSSSCAVYVPSEQSLPTAQTSEMRQQTRAPRKEQVRSVG